MLRMSFMQAFNLMFAFFSATYFSLTVCRKNLLYMCGRDTLTRGKPCDYCMIIQVWGLILRGKPCNYSCLACMCSTCVLYPRSRYVCDTSPVSSPVYPSPSSMQPTASRNPQQRNRTVSTTQNASVCTIS